MVFLFLLSSHLSLLKIGCLFGHDLGDRRYILNSQRGQTLKKSTICVNCIFVTKSSMLYPKIMKIKALGIFFQWNYRNVSPTNTVKPSLQGVYCRVEESVCCKWQHKNVPVCWIYQAVSYCGASLKDQPVASGNTRTYLFAGYIRLYFIVAHR